MKYSLFVSIICVCISCNRTPESGPPGDYKYEVINNAQIEVDSYTNDEGILSINTFKAIDGNKTVFCYKYISEDDPAISDDEVTRILMFEVDSNIDNFVLNTSDLSYAQCVLLQSCFCVVGGNLFAESGSIQGSRNSDNSWDLKIDIQTPVKFIIDATFK